MEPFSLIKYFSSDRKPSDTLLRLKSFVCLSSTLILTKHSLKGDLKKTLGRKTNHPGLDTFSWLFLSFS
jgi:hypothetical protein